VMTDLNIYFAILALICAVLIVWLLVEMNRRFAMEYTLAALYPTMSAQQAHLTATAWERFAAGEDVIAEQERLAWATPTPAPGANRAGETKSSAAARVYRSEGS